MRKTKYFAKICNVVGVLALITVMVAGCGGTKTEEPKDTEEVISTETTEVTTDDIEEILDAADGPAVQTVGPANYYENDADKDFTYQVDDPVDDKFDGKIGGTIKLTEKATIYDKYLVGIGYINPDIELLITGSYNGFFYGTDTSTNMCYIFRIDEVEKMLGITLDLDGTSGQTNNTTNNTNSETNSENKGGSDYTVTDKNATMYAKSSVNLRKGPGTNYDKVGSLTTNQEVKVTGQADNGWYRIEYNGENAFVSDSYLSDTKVSTSSGTNNGNSSNTGNTGNTGSSSNNNGGSTSTPATETPSAPAVETPSASAYSADEVVSGLRSAMSGAGFQWYPDAFPNSKYGPSGGMGWGEVPVAPGQLSQVSSDIIASSQFGCYTYFYIEYVRTDGNNIVVRLYRS